MPGEGDFSTKQYELRAFEPGQLASPRQIRLEDFEQTDEKHLRDYLHVLMRRKWIIAAFFIAVVSLVTISSLLMTPLYKSTAVIKIDKENPNVLAFKDVQVVSPDADYYNTQYKILKSRSLAKRTITDLNLDRNPVFNPMAAAPGGLITSIKDAFYGLIPLFHRSTGKDSSEDISNEPPEMTPLINRFLSSEEVLPEQKSQLVKVSFVSVNPGMSQQIANGIAQAYIDYNIDSRIDASNQARQFLDRQITVLKQKVQASEEALTDYSAKNEMLYADESPGRQSLIDQKLAQIQTDLTAATTSRIQTEALYNQLKQSGTDNTTINSNPIVQDLTSQYDKLEARYYNELRIYKPDFPKMRQMQSQMHAIRKRLASEKKNIVKSINSDYQAAKKKERFLSDEFATEKGLALAYERKNIQYQILKRDADANKDLYNSLLQRVKEVEVAATKTDTNIQVLDTPELPTSPFKPNKSQNILLSIIFGLTGGIGLAFFVEYFDNTLKDTFEIEKTLRLPTLGIIPHHRLAESIRRPMLIHSRTRGVVAEAFRSIGTFILLSSSAKPPKSILVTSPGEREGKTTVSLNTAMALAESVGNGLIIDADLRKPKLHHSFGVDNSAGLSTYLSGNMELEDGLIKKTNTNGLSILTSGPLPPNPSELIVSRRMKDLLDAVYDNFDFIIIDSVPVMGMPDSIYLSSIVDGSVVVIRAGETSKTALSETKRIFRNVNSKILGVILNGMRENDMKYNYYSTYYSSYFKE
ncbi:MAG: polysaccharide biosynthesis tyrosine autokinase [Actinomycetota bacterium]|nr:polysaccharide biosynthesis tyrosine autokinase [Actinomycetota bacterium]